MRRRQVHVYGIAEYRKIGTVAAFEHGSWRVDDDEGRTAYVAADSKVRIGDRVEIEPAFQSTAVDRLNLGPSWVIVRKVDTPQT